MTVNEFIDKLQNLAPRLREKEIVIGCPNGETTEPSIKMQLNDKWDLFGGIDNIKAMILTYE